ncbi:MAG: GNAT family acetyltransferase [Planctomycetota bacterium]
MLFIQPLRDADVDAVVRLWHLCELTRPWNDPHADLAFARRSRDCEVFVGLDDDAQVVSSVMVGHDGHRGWMYYLAVSPTARRRGIGREMVQHAEQWLRNAGVPKLMLMVRESNAAVVGEFYRALGYEAEPVVTFSKWLREPAVPQDRSR